ncbi:MAG: hypothetical protein FWG97_01235 [Deltaproteobacteria bacterium]|nr:hypothetical protein [Deltaproteobacteria bacterium]
MSAESPGKSGRGHGKPQRGGPRRRGSDVITCGLLAALASLVPFFGQPPFDYWFWLLAGALVFNLALAVRRQKRLVRLAARRRAAPDHFLADTGCHLDWSRLGEGLHPAAAGPLTALFKSPSRDLADLKPLVQKALAGLNRARRRQGGHAGAWAYRAFCLALYGQITGRENNPETLRDYPDSKWGALSCQAYARAAVLDPEEASLWADWGRHLEARALSLYALKSPEEGRSARLAALEKYEKALDLAPEFFPASWGRARLLAVEALEAEDKEAMEEAVAAYEEARRGRSVSSAFNLEFGQVVFSLARLAQDRHYCRYAARLFILAAEDEPAAPQPRGLAGRALALAASLSEAPETARELFKEALTLFREAARLDQRDPESREQAAQVLTSLFNLSPSSEKFEGRPAYGFLTEAADWAAQAAGLRPGEETWSAWASILCSLAEYGEKAGRHWGEAVRLYEKAARDRAVSPERAAVNWHNWGYALASLGRTRILPGRRLKLLKQAAHKYAQAAALTRDNLTTLENWGDLLGEMAALTTDPARAARLRRQVVEKFRQAVRLHPREAGPWRRWSAHLQRLAREENNPARRQELWRASMDKMEEAARVNPQEAFTWVFWGRLMLELMGEGPEYERPLMLAGAMEKLEKARDLDRKDDETWSLLGRVCLEAAELPEELNFCGGPLNNASQAGEHFRLACNLNPAEADHWAAWGQALFKVSQLMENDASALAALKEAYERYLTAAALEPAEGEHHTGLGHILYNWGWRIEGAAAKEDRFKKAYEHCGEAGRLAPDDPLVWRNWAKVIEALASLEDDPYKSSAWQNEADEKYYHADALELPGLRPRYH